MLLSLLSHDNNPQESFQADNGNELCDDLGLQAVLFGMAGNAQMIRNSARDVLFAAPPVSREDILYRQQILQSALVQKNLFLRLYDTLDAGLKDFEEVRKHCLPAYSRFAPVTERIHTAATFMELLFTLADAVRKHFETMRTDVICEGLRNYAGKFEAFYSKAFIDRALRETENMKHLSEGVGLTLGVKMGLGFKGTAYVLRAFHPPCPKKTKRPIKRHRATVHLDNIAVQLKAIELRDAALSGILRVANAVVEETTEDLKKLFRELCFYVGCIRLHEKMTAIGVPVCFPEPSMEAGDALSFDGLVDISLALNQNEPPVSNSLELSHARLTIVTGANQGGKSTFLRSVGCGQLMAQCGMFVAARSFMFCPGRRVFTHFCKPEDAYMDRGKLDEELARMNRIVKGLQSKSMLLMNESFASTAEREGAAIAREIVGGFLDLDVKVIFVTHLYEYAHFIEGEGRADVALLRAERCEDGRRTFLIRPGLSLPTSFGMDLYDELIGAEGW